jgi:gas vesicle protein GvpA/GvpJ/GvpM family
MSSNRVLDKGILIDASVRMSVAGIELVSVEARVVVASLEAYMPRGDAVRPIPRYGVPRASGTAAEQDADVSDLPASGGRGSSRRGLLAPTALTGPAPGAAITLNAGWASCRAVLRNDVAETDLHNLNWRMREVDGNCHLHANRGTLDMHFAGPPDRLPKTPCGFLTETFVIS